MPKTSVSLKRNLSLNAMIFYGLGTIVGAGIYVLIGEIAAEAGAWSPLAFLLAAAIASLTGLSYAELVGRFPKSAGEAAYVDKAFKQAWLTELVGWSVVLTGLVSAATLLKGFSGYFNDLFGGTEQVIIGVAVCLMCLLACIGVKQSVGFAVIITLLELVGLLLVVMVSFDEMLLVSNWQRWSHELELFSLSGLVAATFLAFYAFIGFEDMVNMAEEVEDVSNNLPKAIIAAIIISTLIYLLVSMVAVVSLPISHIANSKAPLTVLVASSAWFPSWLISVISLTAVINGVIVQLLMASRVVYGLTKNSIKLQWFARIHPKRQTPINATVVISLLIFCFAFWMPLGQLAKMTSFIILCLFMLINVSLLIIKRKSVYHGFTVSIIIPVAGFLTSFALLAATLIF